MCHRHLLASTQSSRRVGLSGLVRLDSSAAAAAASLSPLASAYYPQPLSLCTPTAGGSNGSTHACGTATDAADELDAEGCPADQTEEIPVVMNTIDEVVIVSKQHVFEVKKKPLLPSSPFQSAGSDC